MVVCHWRLFHLPIRLLRRGSDFLLPLLHRDRHSLTNIVVIQVQVSNVREFERFLLGLPSFQKSQ